MTTRKIIITTASSLLLLAACDPSPEASQTRALEAQQEANQKIDQAQQAATKDIKATRLEANDEIHEAQIEAARKSAEAQTTANETIRDAREDVTKTRSDLRQWAQKKLDEVDGLIDQADSKVHKGTQKAKADYEHEMSEIMLSREQLHEELASIETQTASNLTTFKDRVGTQVDKLKTRVEHAWKVL